MPNLRRSAEDPGAPPDVRIDAGGPDASPAVPDVEAGQEGTTPALHGPGMPSGGCRSGGGDGGGALLLAAALILAIRRRAAW